MSVPGGKDGCDPEQHPRGCTEFAQGLVGLRQPSRVSSCESCPLPFASGPCSLVGRKMIASEGTIKLPDSEA